ncbi:MAG: hypothetical protein ABSH09_36620 [Bryobacteraceae bacterium]|jgi:serine phosphatase RsbU (regulator of sigma subunit)
MSARVPRNEASNQQEEVFGKDLIQQMTSDIEHGSPAQICERIMKQVTGFASAEIPQDDRI